jgi:hypothetical protein
MSGFKVWASDDVLSAADMNSYLMEQVVPVFASNAVRAGAILAPTEGQMTYREDGDIYEFWNGSAWVAIGTAIGVVPNATYALTSGTAVNATKVSNQTVFIQSATPTANATNDLWFW